MTPQEPWPMLGSSSWACIFQYFSCVLHCSSCFVSQTRDMNRGKCGPSRMLQLTQFLSQYVTFWIIFDVIKGNHSVATNRPTWAEPESLASPTLWRSDRRNRHSNVHQSALQASTQSTHKMSNDAWMSHVKDFERPTFPTFTVKVAKHSKTSGSRQRLSVSTNRFENWS